MTIDNFIVAVIGLAWSYMIIFLVVKTFRDRKRIAREIRRKKAIDIFFAAERDSSDVMRMSGKLIGMMREESLFIYFCTAYPHQDPDASRIYEPALKKVLEYRIGITAADNIYMRCTILLYSAYVHDTSGVIGEFISSCGRGCHLEKDICRITGIETGGRS